MQKIKAVILLLVALVHEFFDHGDEKQPHAPEDHGLRVIAELAGRPFPQVLEGNSLSAPFTVNGGFL